MLQGLLETRQNLLNRGISMVVEGTSPPKGIIKYTHDAAMVVTDMAENPETMA